MRDGEQEEEDSSVGVGVGRSDDNGTRSICTTVSYELERSRRKTKIQKVQDGSAVRRDNK